MTPLEPGFYWIRIVYSDQWTLGRHDGGYTVPWTILGVDGVFETSKLFEPDENGKINYELGLRIEPPSPSE